MSSIHIAKLAAGFKVPTQREACCNCVHAHQEPSGQSHRMFGSLPPQHCDKLGCYVHPLSICNHHQVPTPGDAPELTRA